MAFKFQTSLPVDVARERSRPDIGRTPASYHERCVRFHPALLLYSCLTLVEFSDRWRLVPLHRPFL